MNLRDQLSLAFTSGMTRTARGRAHILNQLALAESSGEGRVFDRLLERVEDAQLARMVRRHRDDETRHEVLFTECKKRQGVDPGEVPMELRVIDRLDRKLGGFLETPIASDADVMETYLILQVLEERAVHQFPILERAFRNVDPATADTLRSVAADERRHLRYCQAISRKYAPSENVRVTRLDALRQLEAETFHEANAANMTYSLDHGLLPGALRRGAWRLVGSLAVRSQSLPFTEFRGVSDIQPLLAAA